MATELPARSLVDVLAAALRDLVLGGSLPGGAPLTEQTVAARYDVARPTAKAAIERLVHEGLLRRSANKTARVPLVTAEDIRDLYFSRSFVERDVVAALAGQRRVPAAAQEALVAMRTAVERSSLDDVVGSDIAFHRALVSALGSARLSRMYESVIGEAHLCMAQMQAAGLLAGEDIADEHAAILRAIERGDPAEASAHLVGHLARAAERLTAHCADGPDLAGSPRI